MLVVYHPKNLYHDLRDLVFFRVVRLFQSQHAVVLDCPVNLSHLKSFCKRSFRNQYQRQRQLVLGSALTGRVLEPPIQIPQDASSISISANGLVSIRRTGSQQMENAGQLTLATFINPDGLLKLGENLYAQTDASSAPLLNNPGQSGTGVIRQG